MYKITISSIRFEEGRPQFFQLQGALLLLGSFFLYSPRPPAMDHDETVGHCVDSWENMENTHGNILFIPSKYLYRVEYGECRCFPISMSIHQILEGYPFSMLLKHFWDYIVSGSSVCIVGCVQNRVTNSIIPWLIIL